MAFFWDYFFNNQSGNQNNWQIGKSLNYAKDKIAAIIGTHSHAWCYAWYSTHLFGDPAQKLRIINTNNPVEQNNCNPINETTDVELETSLLSVYLFDPNGNSFNWTIETSPNIGSNSGNNDNNGTKNCNITDLNYNTTYYWYVNTTDGQNLNNSFYTFSTVPVPFVNSAPVLSNENPVNSSNTVSVDLTNITIYIFDPDGNSFNWTIETSPNIGNNTSNIDSNGTKTCNISALSFI
jgi:hypothetical protein